MSNTVGAVIEIIEYTEQPDQDFIVPNDIRINGQSLWAPANCPVVVNEVSAAANDAVRVTLTLFAKRVTVESRERHLSEPQPMDEATWLRLALDGTLAENQRLRNAITDAIGLDAKQLP